VLRQAGVENVSFSYMPPSGKSNNLTTFGFNQQVKQEGFEVNFKAADTGYFSTYGIHFLAGRPYRASDTASEYVVNETLLRKEGIQDPHKALGKYIYLDGNGGPIVGVVADFHEHSLRDPIEPALLATNLKRYTMAGIRLRTEDAPATVQRIEKIFSQYFPDYIFEHQYLSETIARYYDQEEKLSAIFKLFAGIALLISCLGLYGLILFATAQRIREVGIRKVLGASVANISFLFIREFCVLIGIAFLIATPIAWYSMNSWLNNFTYRVQISPWIFVITGLLALLIGMATISYRTVRTALSNPVKNLRSE
jgi:putative ABC transport system permease protein